MQTPTVRLLASTNNARGDLFTRLVKDLFFALGYDDLRLDVHKSGREIDIRGTHRFETRDVIAECKSEKEPIGGRDANTFLGVMTRERDRTPGTQIHGYFVSLSGFRETEVEQELQTSTTHRIILLTGPQVVQELVRSRLLVSREEAVERAGRCAENAGLKADLDGTELLGHQLGYVWAVFYAQGKERTHFALIHADGTPLAEAVAREVVQADRKARGLLHKSKYLGPPASASDRPASAEAAVERYVRWIDEECGFIQLDGLPADTDLSATRMKLERLFVPLNVAITSNKQPREEPAKELVVPVGKLLESNRHMALVAKPGGGKSTLLKRLAIAYAFPTRRLESDDKLPDREWLPLFLRCRELRDRIQRPIVELLDDLPRHAGMNDDEASVFREQIHEALRSGKALLLIDGLDEISEEGARSAFAQHLRTFIAIFPNTAIVVTSREAGFRLIAGVIASVCIQARLAPFDEEDVQRLCERWHVEVVANNEKVRSDARDLADTIWRNERIRALAENPLMLTTLLVVRRCIGDLPTRRVELYREAVRVLIRTWNTEGFAPLDLDEALAQLSYVACAMTETGEQQITQKALIKLLRQSREELVPELQFTQISPERFIERIEYRSSLLMQTGYAQADGEVQPVYEFRHLTFQEYLTARGLVEEQYPSRNEGRGLVELLKPHFGDERWREIIPLAAVLAGRKAEQIIQGLTIAASEVPFEMRDVGIATSSVILRQCLLDEVQVTEATLRAALDQTARDNPAKNAFAEKYDFARLHDGKFGTLFEAIVENGYFGGGEHWQEYLPAQSVIIEKCNFGQDDGWRHYGPRISNGVPSTPGLSKVMEQSLRQSLVSADRIQQCRAALICMNLSYRNASQFFEYSLQPEPQPEPRALLADKFRPLRDALGDLVLAADNDPPVALAACWALVWIGTARLPSTPPSPDVLKSLYRLWRSQSGEFARFASWAFQRQPLLPRDTFALDDFPEADDLFDNTNVADEYMSALIVLAWYRHKPWSDAELLTKIGQMVFPDDPPVFEILLELGAAGKLVLDEIEKRIGRVPSLTQLLAER